MASDDDRLMASLRRKRWWAPRADDMLAAELPRPGRRSVSPVDGASHPGGPSSDPAETDASAYIFTPFSTVPRALARSFRGQLAYCALIFSLPPTALFSYWAYRAASVDLPPVYDGLAFGLVFVAVWAFVTPLWIIIGEHAAAQWIMRAVSDTHFGWNTRGAERWQRRANWLFYPMGVLGAVGAVVILEFVRSTPLKTAADPPGRPGLVLAFIIVAQCGFMALTGLYGVIRWVVVVIGATSGVDLDWHPFRQRPPTLSAVYRVSLMLALFFSCAALCIPALVVIADGPLNPVARVVVQTFLVLMFFGGLLIFTLPISAVVAGLRRGKRKYLARLESGLHRLISELLGHPTLQDQESLATADAIQRVIAIRASVSEAQVLPLGRTVGRALLTVVIPIVSLLLSVLQANIVTL